MKASKIFWGLFFIGAAVFLIVSRLGLLGDISFWSLTLGVFFAGCLIKSIFSKSISGVLFSLAFLCIVFDEFLGIEAITPWPVLGAALLCSIGCSFFYHPVKKPDRHGEGCMRHYGNRFSETVETVEDTQMDFDVSFGGSIKYINSDNFQSARLKCSFGSLKVFFDNALIQNGNADIYLDISFGGVELYIPRTWKVINHTNCTFGGINEKNMANTTGAPGVTLSGKVSFAGVEIIYV